MKLNKDLVAASAVPLILSLLAEGESYGYAILQWVREVSGGAIEWTDGMLYPVLHRLEAQGYVASHWGASEAGRRRKYYALKGAGQEALAEQKRQWLAVGRALAQLWGEMPWTTSNDGSPSGGGACPMVSPAGLT